MAVLRVKLTPGLNRTIGDRRDRDRHPPVSIAVIARFATYADQAIQVDDFPADFDIAAGLERRQAAEIAPRKTTKKAA